MATIQIEITNNDTKEYTEKFREKEIRIPAGGSIVMAKSDANSFLAQMAQDERGKLKPKMLSSRAIGSQSGVSHTCSYCGKDFLNAEALLEHGKAHSAHAYKNEELDKKEASKAEEYPFKCPFCEFACKSDFSMKRHIEVKHIKKGNIKDDTESSLQPNESAVGGK
jgi:hypothetical protein